MISSAGIAISNSLKAGSSLIQKENNPFVDVVAVVVAIIVVVVLNILELCKLELFFKVIHFCHGYKND